MVLGDYKLVIVPCGKQDSAGECEQLCHNACSLPCDYRQGFKLWPILILVMDLDLDLDLD
jgi:hypothetical protein